jgi:hypothetical protein
MDLREFFSRALIPRTVGGHQDLPAGGHEESTMASTEGDRTRQVVAPTRSLNRNVYRRGRYSAVAACRSSGSVPLRIPRRAACQGDLPSSSGRRQSTTESAIRHGAGRPHDARGLRRCVPDCPCAFQAVRRPESAIRVVAAYPSCAARRGNRAWALPWLIAVWSSTVRLSAESSAAVNAAETPWS